MKLGLLFGSFDPIHNGHLSVVQQAFKDASCNQVLLIVQPSNNYKKTFPQATLDQRIQMAKLAVSDIPNVEVNKLSSTVPPEHSIASTLNQLKQLDHKQELVLLLGDDLAQTMPYWPDYDQIMKFCQIFVAKRRVSDVSSRQIRSAVEAKEPLGRLLPQNVANYINEHNLY